LTFCTNCGKPVKEQHNFCQSCGKPIEPVMEENQSPASPEHPAVTGSYSTTLPVAPAETISVIIPDLQLSRPSGKRDSYYLVVTGRRSIFAKITDSVMQKAAQMHREKNPDQGKGFFSRWKAQIAGPNIYLERYKILTPEQALADSPENFVLDNSQIQMVLCKYYYREDFPSEWHLEFQIPGNNYKFITTTDPVALLKKVYPNIRAK